MGLWLTDEELEDLTGKVQRQTQIDVIRSIYPPIIFRVRGTDNFPLVDRWQFTGEAKPKTGTPAESINTSDTR